MSFLKHGFENQRNRTVARAAQNNTVEALVNGRLEQVRVLVGAAKKCTDSRIFVSGVCFSDFEAGPQCMRLDGFGQKINLIPDDVSERAAVRRLEGFYGNGVGFDDVTCSMNRAVKRNENAFTGRFRRTRQTDGI